MARIIDIASHLDSDGVLEIEISAFDGDECMWIDVDQLEAMAAAFGFELTPTKGLSNAPRC